MKNQYFGDVNDYIKYGLLRVLSQATRVGVAWMLTPDDDRTDGPSRTAYRKDLAWREHYPDSFHRLARLAAQPSARNVELFRRWDLVLRALDVEALLPEIADARGQWLAAALQALEPCPLVFFDPERASRSTRFRTAGAARAATCTGTRRSRRGRPGHSLLVYQHFPRESRETFVERLTDLASRRLAGARVASFRSDHVLFLLASRPEHAAALSRAAEEAARRWAGRLEVSSLAPPAGSRRRSRGRLPGIFGRDGQAGRCRDARPALPCSPRSLASEREHSELDALRVWVRDGFLDRYDGTARLPGHAASALGADASRVPVPPELGRRARRTRRTGSSARRSTTWCRSRAAAPTTNRTG